MAFLTISILCFFGFLFSLYSFSVEKKLEKNQNYKAVCDISEHISCTAAAKSDYSTLGGIKNSIKGMLFYPFISVLAWFDLKQYIFYLAAASMVMTIYFIFISYFKLKNYCLVCSGVYFVNILLLVFSWLWYVN